MTGQTVRSAGILLMVYPTVVYGGVSLLRLLTKRSPYYVESPLRQRLWRAGHAHAGVLLLLSLVMLSYVDRADLPDGAAAFAASAAPLAAILIPAAYFLSVLRRDAERPNRLIVLAYAGAVVLAAGMLTLGIGLLRAA
jgi:hypothetical protein